MCTMDYGIAFVGVKEGYCIVQHTCFMVSQVLWEIIIYFGIRIVFIELHIRNYCK